MNRQEQAAQRKAGITSGKYGGDDSASYAVFINGQPFVTGLTRREVAYYRKQAMKRVSSN